MSDREEILNICTDFYKSLYIQIVLTPDSTMKSSPVTERIPEFTEEDVEKTTKKMKKHKLSPPTKIMKSQITYQRQSRFLTVGMNQKQ